MTRRPAVPAAMQPRPATSPSPGQPLASTLRARLERQTGTNLGTVRLHTDNAADRVASMRRANAVTFGHDIYFAAGRFRPETTAGFGLLVHELTHVRQAAAGAVPGGPLASMQQHALETEARTHEHAAMRGLPLPALRTAGSSTAPGSTPHIFPHSPHHPASTMPSQHLPSPSHGGGGTPVGNLHTDLFQPLPMALSAPPAAHPPALRQEIGTAVTPSSAEAAADTTGTAPAPTAADPDALAEQVYARIERRLRLEHERGGTRRWR